MFRRGRRGVGVGVGGRETDEATNKTMGLIWQAWKEGGRVVRCINQCRKCRSGREECSQRRRCASCLDVFVRDIGS